MLVLRNLPGVFTGSGEPSRNRFVGVVCLKRVAGLVLISCPKCGRDLVYSPIPPLFFCLDRMEGERIMISMTCGPWIADDASAKDLLQLTEKIGKLAVEIQV